MSEEVIESTPSNEERSIDLGSFIEEITLKQENESTSRDSVEDPTNTGILFWATSGCCISVLFFVFIFGIVGFHVPWLGIFTIFSVVPGVFILWLVYWRKHKDKAYLNFVAKFVLFGMLGVPVVAILEYLIMWLFGLIESNLQGMPFVFNLILESFFQSFFVASLTEEGFKFLLAYTIKIQPGREVPYSIVIYSLAGALGLATFENMMYILSVGIGGSIFLTGFTTVFRALLSVPLHSCTGILIGTSVARRKMRFEKINFFWMLLMPILLHGIYDFFTIMPTLYYTETQQTWIFFFPIFSVATVVYGIYYARKQAIGLLSNGGYSSVSDTQNV